MELLQYHFDQDVIFEESRYKRRELGRDFTFSRVVWLAYDQNRREPYTIVQDAETEKRLNEAYDTLKDADLVRQFDTAFPEHGTHTTTLKP